MKMVHWTLFLYAVIFFFFLIWFVLSEMELRSRLKMIEANISYYGTIY